MISRKIRRYILNPEYDKNVRVLFNDENSYDYIGYECDTGFTVIYRPFGFLIKSCYLETGRCFLYQKYEEKVQ